MYVLGGGAVLDKETGLVWEAFLSANPAVFNWFRALEHCLFRKTGGRMGWRLPSVSELMSLLVPSDPIDLPAGHLFCPVQRNQIYWTATTVGTDPSSAWWVQFGTRGAPTFVGQKTADALVWCVRGGGPLTHY